jgi:hypothetical protein
MPPIYDEMYLVDAVECALRGAADPARVLRHLCRHRDADIDRIWSFALQRMAWPPRARRPWWKRIWSNWFGLPTPDNRPGGCWR